jgi:paraquat-inducible protein B
MYQGLEVGQLTKLNLNPGGKVTGEMTVDPSVVTLLRENADSDEEAENLAG